VLLGFSSRNLQPTLWSRHGIVGSHKVSDSHFHEPEECRMETYRPLATGIALPGAGHPGEEEEHLELEAVILRDGKMVETIQRYPIQTVDSRHPILNHRISITKCGLPAGCMLPSDIPTFETDTPCITGRNATIFLPASKASICEVHHLRNHANFL
jgi:hypothetical protein